MFFSCPPERISLPKTFFRTYCTLDFTNKLKKKQYFMHTLRTTLHFSTTKQIARTKVPAICLSCCFPGNPPDYHGSSMSGH
jgi:hypothetical protein